MQKFRCFLLVSLVRSRDCGSADAGVFPEIGGAGYFDQAGQRLTNYAERDRYLDGGGLEVSAEVRHHVVNFETYADLFTDGMIVMAWY